MGYAPPGTSPLELIALAQEAERLGYDSAWAAEAWGTDAVTVLSWLAASASGEGRVGHYRKGLWEVAALERIRANEIEAAGRLLQAAINRDIEDKAAPIGGALLPTSGTLGGGVVVARGKISYRTSSPL